MDAVFISENKKKIYQVYSEKQFKKLNIDIDFQEVFSKKDVKNKIVDTTKVQYVFTTWGMPEWNHAEIEEFFPSLKALFYAAGSVKSFARPFLEKGIRVYSAGVANGTPVAEFTVAQIILANKGYYHAVRSYSKPLHRLAYNKAHLLIDIHPGNYMATIGIVGAGMVGRKVIKLLQPYDLNVVVYDPYVNDQIIESFGAKKVDLIQLVKMSDVISNHLPDLESTRNVFSYNLLKNMKTTATFINTGRGAQVNEKDLIRVLKEESSRAAVLDVTKHEPLWPWSPLYWCKNVFLTPHMAGSTGNETFRLGEYIVQAYSAFKEGNHSNMEVTLEMLEYGA